MKESFFGYFKNDGYEKTKNEWRIDKKKLYEEIKNERLHLFFNRKEKTGLSALKAVSGNDEWCAEAYMATDYSELSEEIFVENIKKYLLFKELTA
jgi:hypothetical protein